MARQEYGRAYGKYLSIKSDFPHQTDFISVDFHPNKLIVRVPTIGHEIMTDLFYLMKQSGTGYSAGSYRGSRIVLGGSADIHYTSGYKSPDFSLYEVKDGGGDTIDDDTTTPTIVFEIAYTQTTRSVVLEATRHICLTGGEVLLVIAIDIVHKKNMKPRELESVTWSHWEEDIDSFDEVKNPDDYEINNVSPDRGEGDNDEDYVLPPATAFTGVIHGPDKQHKYHIRAVQTDKWRVRRNISLYNNHIDNIISSYSRIPRSHVSIFCTVTTTEIRKR